eukprot:1195244-Prorocentrum_minimum.AAC.2
MAKRCLRCRLYRTHARLPCRKQIHVIRELKTRECELLPELMPELSRRPIPQTWHGYESHKREWNASRRPYPLGQALISITCDDDGDGGDGDVARCLVPPAQLEA